MVIYYYIIYIIITHDRDDMETLFLRLVSLSLVILFLLLFLPCGSHDRRNEAVLSTYLSVKLNMKLIINLELKNLAYTSDPFRIYSLTNHQLLPLYFSAISQKAELPFSSSEHRVNYRNVRDGKDPRQQSVWVVSQHILQDSRKS